MSLAGLSCTLNYSGTDKESQRNAENMSQYWERHRIKEEEKNMELVEWVHVLIEAFSWENVHLQIEVF